MESCGKIYHLTEEAANVHADELERTCGQRPNVYKCPRCGTWHVGYASSAKLSKRGRRNRRASHSTRKRKRASE